MKKYGSFIKNVLQFTIIYKLIILFCLSPILRLILKEYLKKASVSIAFNQNMIEVFLSLPGIIIFLILVLTMMLLIYYNLYVIIQIITLEHQKQSYQLKEIVLKSIINLKTIHKPTFVLSGLYMLLLLPLVHVGYINNYVPRWDIPSFILNELQLTLQGQILTGLIYLLYYGLYIMMIFVPLYLFLKQMSLIQAIKKGCHLLKTITFSQKIRLLMSIIAWVIVENSIIHILPYPLLHNRDFNIYFVKYLMHFASFRYSVIQYIIIYLLQIIAMTFFLNYLVSLFCQYEKEIITIQQQNLDTIRLQRLISHCQKTTGYALCQLKQYFSQIQWIRTYQKYLRIICIICIFIVGIVYFHQDLRLHKPYVIGHRGSGYAIENTFEAVEKANDYGSDFAEIDIQLSKDGIPIVYHDTTMSRLSHVSTSVSQMTAQQFEDTTLQYENDTAQPTTLEHLIQKMQDHHFNIKLLIEFKADPENYREMVNQVVKIVNQYHMGSQTMFMSLHYPTVSYLHHLYPEWWIGYCIYGSIGDIDASIWNMDIDFLAIEENRASTSLIQKAISQMIPIYIWTVDNEKKMKQYLDMGVSGIITNDPDLGRQAIDAYLQKHPHSYYEDQI
ncbi:MAG: glycerophosphodiester phosphodiesterase family protein [Massilimicrobiota timonensis]